MDLPIRKNQPLSSSIAIGRYGILPRIFSLKLRCIRRGKAKAQYLKRPPSLRKTASPEGIIWFSGVIYSSKTVAYYSQSTSRSSVSQQCHSLSLKRSGSLTWPLPAGSFHLISWKLLGAPCTSKARLNSARESARYSR